MSGEQLFRAMKFGQEITINGIRGRIVRLEPESGVANIHNWLVTLRSNDGDKVTYVKTGE